MGGVYPFYSGGCRSKTKNICKCLSPGEPGFILSAPSFPLPEPAKSGSAAGGWRRPAAARCFFVALFFLIRRPSRDVGSPEKLLDQPGLFVVEDLPSPLLRLFFQYR